jgi:hypothetical protein
MVPDTGRHVGAGATGRDPCGPPKRGRRVRHGTTVHATERHGWATPIPGRGGHPAEHLAVAGLRTPQQVDE